MFNKQIVLCNISLIIKTKAMIRNKKIIFYFNFVIISSILGITFAINKYSSEANEAKDENSRPFRMMKLNQLWEKALKVFIYQSFNY